MIVQASASGTNLIAPIRQMVEAASSRPRITWIPGRAVRTSSAMPTRGISSSIRAN